MQERVCNMVWLLFTFGSELRSGPSVRGCQQVDIKQYVICWAVNCQQHPLMPAEEREQLPPQ